MKADLIVKTISIVLVAAFKSRTLLEIYTVSSVISTKSKCEPNAKLAVIC